MPWASMPGAHSSTWQRCTRPASAVLLRPGRGEQGGEVLAYPLLPHRPLVATRALVQRRAVALQRERRGDTAVVVDVVLVAPDGEHGRQGALELLLPDDLAHEANDAPVAGEALLHVVVARREER